MVMSCDAGTGQVWTGVSLGALWSAPWRSAVCSRLWRGGALPLGLALPRDQLGARHVDDFGLCEASTHIGLTARAVVGPVHGGGRQAFRDTRDRRSKTVSNAKADARTRSFLGRIMCG